MHKRIKYFTYHGCNNPDRFRFNSPASDSLVDYIVSVLNRCGYSVDIISRAQSSTNKYLSGSIEKERENTIRFFASFGKKNNKLWVFNMWFMNIQFFIWCLANIKKGEQVLVYHSLGYTRTFLFLKKYRKIRIVGEINEIYQDVHKQRAYRCKKEYDFINNCDKYIFTTELLNKKLNQFHKPFIIIHGLYSIENVTLPKFNDGKIHVVYGGTLDKAKGCGTAAEATLFLPRNYHVHICGFGKESEINEIKSIVNSVVLKSKASITFEGELVGKQYNEFIQKCHIGLCPQDPNMAFNSTSFPSKILVYLANGLNVVSINIPAIQDSAVSTCISFYNNQNPEEIANAIIECSKTTNIGQQLLLTLDCEFKNNLGKLLCNNTSI